MKRADVVGPQRRRLSWTKPRRRPTAGTWSSQAQPSERHLLFEFVRRRVSLALEVRLPLLPECLDALVGVLRHEHATDRLALQREAEVERRAEALRDGELRVTESYAWAARDLGCVVDRPLAACGCIGKQAVDQTGLLRLGRRHGRGVDDHFQAFRKADEPRQPLGAAAAGEESQVQLRKADLV